MSVLLFLVLHALKQLGSPYDSYVLCVLLALELPQWAMVLVYLRKR